MKTQKIIQTPIAKQMYDLRLKSFISIANGRYKDARIAQKDFAKLAVENFSEALQVPQPNIGSFPWYSSYGLNSIKFDIYKIFRTFASINSSINQ